MTETALGLVKAESFQDPTLIADIGPEATKRYFEFFAVPILNKNTRIAYYHVIGQFLDWCHRAAVAWPSHERDERDSRPSRRVLNLLTVAAPNAVVRKCADEGLPSRSATIWVFPARITPKIGASSNFGKHL